MTCGIGINVIQTHHCTVAKLACSYPPRPTSPPPYFFLFHHPSLGPKLFIREVSSAEMDAIFCSEYSLSTGLVTVYKYTRMQAHNGSVNGVIYKFEML